MALDPSISLQVQPPAGGNIFAGAEKGLQLRALSMKPEQIAQEISASKAAQANTEAQLPGLQADAAGKARDNAAAEMAKNMAASGKYTTTADDGTKTINTAKLYGDLASNGYIQQAFTFARTAADTQSTQIKTEGERQKFVDDRAQDLANIISKSVPKDQQPAAFQSGMSRVAAHYPELFANSNYFTQDPKTGAPVLAGEFKAADVKSIADGKMDPLTSANLEISQNSLKLAQMQADPNYKATISTIPSAETRVGVQANNSDTQEYIDKLKAGAASAVPSATYGKAGSVTADIWNKLVGQNPDYAALQTSIDAYNKTNGTQYSVAGNGVDAVKSLLNQEVSNKTAGLNRKAATVSGPTVQPPPVSDPNAAPPTPAQIPQATPALQDGGVYRGKLVASPQKAANLPAGTQFYGLDGQLRTKK